MKTDLEIEYRCDTSHHDMIIRLSETLNTEGYPVRMLLTNSLPSILKCHMQNVDDEVFLCFDISRVVPLRESIMSGTLSLETLNIIYESYMKVLEEMEEYLLSPSQVILDPEYVYYDTSTKALMFVFLPGYIGDVQEAIRTLGEMLLPLIDHKDSRAVRLGYRVFQTMMEEPFSLDRIREQVYQPEELLPENENIEVLNSQLWKEDNRYEGEDSLSTEQIDEEIHKELSGKARILICSGISGILAILLLTVRWNGWFSGVSLELLIGGWILISGFAFFGIYIREQKAKRSRQKESDPPGVFDKEEDEDYTRISSFKGYRFPAGETSR